MGIDWKRKLTSRKFWAAIAEFVTMLIIALKGTQETATQVTALIMAGGAVIAYIIGEGLTDAAAAKGNGYYATSGYAAYEDEPPEEEEDPEETAEV